MIPEKNIDKAIEMVADNDTFIGLSKMLIEQHPALVAYLNSESFEILSEDEKDLLWYCTIVILKSMELSGLNPNAYSINKIQDSEEKNYTQIGEKDLKFAQIADILFKDYIQEDLLAFAEDTLIPDEEDFPSPVGRKVIFITLKTVIDVLA